MNPLAERIRNAVAQLFAPAVTAPQPLYRQTAVFQVFDWLAGVPDPDEVLRRTGRSRADLREILRDAEVSQALDTRREAVLATPWRLQGGAARGAKVIEEALTPHMQTFFSSLWNAVPYGYSVIEVVYLRDGARIGIDGVFAPPFEWFRPIPDGTLRFFPQSGEGGLNGIQCDPRKFILAVRHGDYRNPYGESLLSTLYWPVTWRLQGWQSWLEFLDTFGSPIIVGKTASYEKFVEAMLAQGVKRAVAWQPQGDKESLEAITASGPGEFERLEEALNKCIARVVLGQTLTSDVGDKGSYAAAKVHDEVREDKRRADIRLIVGSMQRVVDSLWTLNAFPGEPPTFDMQDDVGLEKERADRDKLLVDMGVRFTEKYVSERYDLQTGDFTLTDPTPPQPFGGAAPAPSRSKLSAAGTRFTPEQQAIEERLADILDGVAQPIDPALISEAIKAAATPQDLIHRLAVVLGDADPKAFQTVLERALFAADVMGYAHASRQA